MSVEKWDKVFAKTDPIVGKEVEQSRDKLVDFLDALMDDAKSGALFKYGLISFKEMRLPNGFTVRFDLKEGVPDASKHVFGEPKPSRSMAERKISRCIYCGCAYAKRITNKRCLDRDEHNRSVAESSP